MFFLTEVKSMVMSHLRATNVVGSLQVLLKNWSRLIAVTQLLRWEANCVVQLEKVLLLRLADLFNMEKYPSGE